MPYFCLAYRKRSFIAGQRCNVWNEQQTIMLAQKHVKNTLVFPSGKMSFCEGKTCNLTKMSLVVCVTPTPKSEWQLKTTEMCLWQRCNCSLFSFAFIEWDKTYEIFLYFANETTMKAQANSVTLDQVTLLFVCLHFLSQTKHVKSFCVFANETTTKAQANSVTLDEVTLLFVCLHFLSQTKHVKFFLICFLQMRPQ